MIIENFQGIIELLIIMGGVTLCVKLYVNTEAEKQLEKARIYAERDIRTANIEANVMQNGFNEPAPQAEGDTIQQLIGLAMANPAILKSFLGGGGAGSMPASFQATGNNVPAQASDIKK